MRQRYRYIMNGIAVGTDPIGDFRLIAANNLGSMNHNDSVLRVQIPDDLELIKYSCDSYSTTDDRRTLDELGYDYLFWDESNQKLIARNEYKGTRPCDIERRYLLTPGGDITSSLI